MKRFLVIFVFIVLFSFSVSAMDVPTFSKKLGISGGDGDSHIFILQLKDSVLREKVAKQTVGPIGRAGQVSAVGDLLANTGKRNLFNSDRFIAVNLSKTELVALLKNPSIENVDVDQNISIALDVSTPSVNAPTVWAAGFDGGVPLNFSNSTSIVVGVVDTGIAESHPALKYTRNSSLRSFQNHFEIDWSADDENGHGTHVAGIIASSDSKYTGVAPGLASILNLKVLNRYGGGSSYGVMSAMDWAFSSNNPSQFKPNILSNSWGYGYMSDSCVPTGSVTNGLSSLSLYLDDLAAKQPVLLVFAAGNEGSAYAEGVGSFECNSSIRVGGDAFNAITVGSLETQRTLNRSDDEISWFSSRGPTSDGRKKPDIVAPGGYTSSTDYLSDGFANMAGTSMAAPHVSGAAALFMSQGLSPLEVKALFINTAEDRGAVGGIIDTAGAILIWQMR